MAEVYRHEVSSDERTSSGPDERVNRLALTLTLSRCAGEGIERARERG